MSKLDRLPKKGGAAEAMKKLKEMRKKEPSDRLVQIIEEVTNQKPNQKDAGLAAQEVEL